MTEIQTALLESYRHWDDNVKNYLWRAGANKKRKWFYKNAEASKCALCQITGCDGCILWDKDYICGKEWNILYNAILSDSSRLHHVEAVRDRLKAECEKEGLL